MPNSVDRLCEADDAPFAEVGPAQMEASAQQWFRLGASSSSVDVSTAVATWDMPSLYHDVYSGMGFRHSKSRCTMISTHFPSSRILTAHAAF